MDIILEINIKKQVYVLAKVHSESYIKWKVFKNKKNSIILFFYLFLVILFILRNNGF